MFILHRMVGCLYDWCARDLRSQSKVETKLTWREGTYSVTARATIIVTSACSVVTAALFLLYNTIMLNLVKRRHERETRAVEQNQGMLDSDFQNRRRDGNGLDQTV